MEESELIPWRTAVKKAMKEATKAESQRRYNTTKPSFNYRWEHVTAVVQLAIKLAELTGADRDVVEAAAWLHDICKEAAGPKHPREGAKFAKELLPQTDFPPEKIEWVAKTIDDHMGLWLKKPLKKLESQVLWDADKLAKLGLTAAFHWTGNVLSKNDKTWKTKKLIANGRNAEWQEKTVASMHTKPAQEAAIKRLAAYNELWNNLENELKGNDLVA